ncbi:hypothetical protein PFLU3_10010 [Pseudomonas fluorescens]|uniref:Integrase n=1 Tax=Pseudomonas fluorescens TaxID=294 RepID=A0A0D0TS70_PSEFL|nr:hypothetical protein PFLU3_10010 [Pseudomonas fluorescens]
MAATSSRGHKNETIRDIISDERQVFRFYQMRKKAAHDPTEGLLVRIPDPEAPTPFTRTKIRQNFDTLQPQPGLSHSHSDYLHPIRKHLAPMGFSRSC